MERERRSGILCHPSSLPGAGPIGTLGDEAFRFVDFLVAAEQSLWQILPLNPVSSSGSPYTTPSSFAGNPLLIDLRLLMRQGLLKATAEGAAAPGQAAAVNFDDARSALTSMRDAWARFEQSATAADRSCFAEYRAKEAAWLDDYTLFEALRSAHEEEPWYEWERKLARREARALADARRSLAEDLDYHAFVQYVFDQQWSAVRRYANERGVRIIGDIPIYVARDSADVWSNQELFKLDETGAPAVVAGVPPDLFSKSGQLWGNPCYDWPEMERHGYDWWVQRFRRTLQHCDLVRLDHFRGFVAGWQVPAGEETAIAGRWVPGPGRRLFNALESALGPLPVIVEDLGVITEDVDALREELGYPGMKVLQFAFGDGPDNPYLPHNYEANCVVYTGTHDNDTSIGWVDSLSPTERDRFDRYLGPHDPDPAWAMIRLAQASVARFAITPLQDVLSLGSEARMNLPGTADGNWRWRCRAEMLGPTLAARLAMLARDYGRAPRR